MPLAVVCLIRFAEARSIPSDGNRFAGAARSGAAAALIARLGQFDSIVSWYGSNREEFRGAVRELGLPFQFFDALPAARRKDSRGGFLFEASRRSWFRGAEDRVRARRARRFRGDSSVFGKRAEELAAGAVSGSGRELAMPVRWCAGPQEPLPPELTSDAVRFEDLYELGAGSGARESILATIRESRTWLRRWERRGRGVWADRSGGVGAARGTSAGGERRKSGPDRGR